MKKILKKISIVLIIVLVIELLVWLIIRNYRENSLSYEDNYNEVIAIEDGYLAVGCSNFHNNKDIEEKYYEHEKEDGSKETIVGSHARITKLDKEYHVIWDKAFESRYESVFNSIIKVDNGYIAVGSYKDKYSQIDDKTSTGLIVLYDESGNVIKKQTYQVLGDTKFRKIIFDGEYYIVVGQSIYENMEIGTHITGGGIIIKMNNDLEIIEENNYGGNKSGIFNDVIAVSDGYIVCGKDSYNTGIVVKFKKNFNREEKDVNPISEKVVWYRDFDNTDDYGFTSMVLKDNKLYIAGAIAVDQKDDVYFYDAGYAIFQTDSKYLDRVVIGGSNFERVSDILIDNDQIILLGSTNSNDFNKKKLSGTQTGFILTYDFNNNLVDEYYYGNKDNNIFNNIIKDDKYTICGTTNEGVRFHNYQAIVYKLDDKFQIIAKNN